MVEDTDLKDNISSNSYHEDIALVKIIGSEKLMEKY